MKRADLIGQKFGLLTVVKFLGTTKRGKTNAALWECACDCGSTSQATTGDLRSGKRVSCGCNKHKTGIPKRTTHVGDVYNYLTVLEEVGKDNDNRMLYRCSCSRCGGEIITTGKRLRKGITKSCGCLKRDCMLNAGAKNFRDLTGQTFGYLVVIDRAPTRYSKAGNPTTMWNCYCLLCGNNTVVAGTALTSDRHTRSCGCLKMSYAELDINNELHELNINFINQYSFYDLVSPTSGKLLRFDFALFNKENKLMSLLEYQGPQHFQKYANGFGDFQREVTDGLKEKYCEKHSIPLYKIAYDQETIPALHDILQKVYNIAI